MADDDPLLALVREKLCGLTPTRVRIGEPYAAIKKKVGEKSTGVVNLVVRTNGDGEALAWEVVDLDKLSEKDKDMFDDMETKGMIQDVLDQPKAVAWRYRLFFKGRPTRVRDFNVIQPLAFGRRYLNVSTDSK